MNTGREGMERGRGVVRLRPIVHADLAVLERIQAEPEGCAMAGVHGRPTKEFFAHWEKILAEVKVVPRVIEVDGEIAGSISCFERDGKDFVGYWLGRAYWGRGGGSDRGHCRCCWKR